MNKYERILSRLGFNSYESGIYLTLLSGTSKSITEISHETGFHRPVIYKVLKNLMERGYAEITPGTGKRKHYRAGNPKSLSQEIEAFTRDSTKVIEELSSIFAITGDIPVLTIKSGIEGLKAIHKDLIDTLPQNGIYYRYSSSHRHSSERSKYVPDNYFEVQKRKELERYVITNETMKKLRSDNPMREVVAIPEGFDLFDDNFTKLIYANKVAIMDYNTETGWLIESATFAQYERKIFQLLFSLLKKENNTH